MEASLYVVRRVFDPGARRVNPVRRVAASQRRHVPKVIIMFEQAIAYYLNEYLGAYVEGIDKEALSVSVVKGDVTLRNSRIKPDALSQHLDLPVSVRAGVLDTLTLKVPWNALGSTPVVVTMDGMYLLVRAKEGGAPESSEGGGRSLDGREYFEAGYQHAKVSRVQRKEQAWMKEQAAAMDGESPSSSSSSFLSSLIETIVGNLQVSIKNIHIRYEDDVTRPGHPFACGFTLQNLEAFTVDATGDRRFVAAKAMDALRKAVELQRLAVYFDCNISRAAFWSPSMDVWGAMGSAEWDSWFRPAIVGVDASHSYVLRPVDGTGRYVRKRDVVELDVRLESIALSVSQDQFRNYSLLLSEATEYLKRLPYQDFRPGARATDDPRAWWLYAVYAHRQQAAAKRRLSWGDALYCIGRKSEYCSLYKVCLRMEEMRKSKDARAAITDELEALYDRDTAIMRGIEARLPEACILMFRLAARMEYRADVRALEAAQAAVERERRRNEAGSGGWIGWLMGTGAAAPEAITTLTTKEEQDVIVDALAATAATQPWDEASIDVLGRKRQYAVRVNSVSMNFVDRDGVGDHRPLLCGSMTGIDMEFTAYPDRDMETGTRDIRLRIERSAIESYKGSFTESKSLAVRFVKSPPDGQSDALLRVDMAPSFVYYDPEVVTRVVEFFKPPEELVLNDLADLSVAAAEQLSRARQLAQEYAVAAWSGKPKLDMRLILNAPKISIPSKAGDVHLALDFGTFIIETDREGLAELPPREMGLYECIRISGSQVSARFMGSTVDWESSSSQDSLLEECSLNMPLHIARYADAELPAMRAAPIVPRIRLTLSPKKLNHLGRVLQNCLESFTAQGSNATAAAISGQAWLAAAEWERDGLLLQWGTLQSSATWTRQRLVLYSSTLYAVESSSNRIVRQWTVSASSTFARLCEIAGLGNDQPGPLRDAERVLVLYEGQSEMDPRDIVRDAKSWVVKFDSLEDAESCLEELRAVIHRQIGDGRGHVEERDFDAQKGDQGASAGSIRLEVEARLNELQVQLAGRCASLDDRLAPGEVDLVCMNASKGTLSISYGSTMRIGVSLVSLDVEDLMSPSMGSGEGSMTDRFLAQSIQDCSSSASPNLVDFEVVTSGSQTSVNANLGSLSLFCHRRLLAALMSFGTDTAAAFYAQSDPSKPYSGNNEGKVGTNENILAPDVVLYCEKKDAITFALAVQMSKLQLRLCYEDGSSLAEASVTDFSFVMDNISDGRSKIAASLGDLRAVDLTLAADNPHARICGLRDEDGSSLVSIKFEMIPAHVDPSLHSLRVPLDMPYCYLEARLSKVQVTFLYRFVQELIQYGRRMFEFQPPCLETDVEVAEPMGALALDPTAPSPMAPLAGAGQAQHSGTVLLLKVEMEAPLIIIPRDSRSKDGFNADLGTLSLENEVVSLPSEDGITGNGDGINARAKTRTLVDVSTLKLYGIRIYPTNATRGDEESLVRLSEEGWTVKWRRPLQDPLGSLPGIEVEVDIPILDASISNDEYRLLRTVVVDNVWELTRVDGPPVNGPEAAGPVETQRASLDSMPSCGEYPAVKESIDYRVYVNLGDLQLRLLNPTTSLGLLQIANLYISYTSFNSGNACLTVSMPKLEVMDTRPHARDEAAMVISSGQHASLLVLRYASGPNGKDADIILQKPHIALELGFLIDLTAFFVPTFSFSRTEPLPFRSHDILLPPATGSAVSAYTLGEDIWLSPSVRILADSVMGETYIIDGGGHNIVLPKAGATYDEIPLIMIGAQCCLELRNVTLVNADALSPCMHLGHGARLDASPERGVRVEKDPIRGGSREEPHRAETIRLIQDAKPDAINQEGGGEDLIAASDSLNITLKAVNLGLDLMPRRATGRPLSGSSPSSAPVADASVRIIAFKMDLDATYATSPDKGQMLKVDVWGLRAAQKSLKPQALKAAKEMDILLPVAISFGYSSTEKDIDMNLEISEISLLVSPGSLALMTHYAQEAFVPLRQPGPDSPVCAVSTYRKVAAPPDIKGFRETWVTFWRPTVPTGYVVAGDLAIGGDRAPNFEVIALARNSGLIAHPESFLPIISNANVSLWLPVAPAGYVAIGLLATTGLPPDPLDVGCVACGAVIAAPRGSSLEHWGGFDGIDLVNVDNSFGTFIPLEAGAFDLRFPLGPTTYALEALVEDDGTGLPAAASRSNSFGEARQRDYLASEATKQRVESRSVNSPKTMEFRRIWSDTGAFSAPMGVSIWRPIPHPGYATLGDCFVTGLDPPRFVHLLRVEAYSNHVAAESSSTAPALDFEFVWHDGNPRPEDRLTIWRPVAPDGFRSMGHVGHVGMTKPELPELRCVRERLAHPSATPRRPVWRVPKEHPGTSALRVWRVDDQTNCFSVDSRDDGAAAPQAFALDLSSLEGRDDNPGKTVNYVVRSPAISITFFDSFGVPMVRSDVHHLESGVRGYSQQVVQAYGGLRPSLLAYNPKIGTWEHVLQPFDAIVTGSLNMSQRTCSGIDPGVRITLKSSTEMVAMTLALSHLNAVVSSYEECLMALSKGNQQDEGMAHGDQESLYGGRGKRTSVMTNSLGVGVEVILEDLDSKEQHAVTIGDGEAATIQRTYHGSMKSSSGARSSASARAALLLDVKDLHVSDTLHRRGLRVAVSTRIEDANEKPLGAGLDPRTRAIILQRDGHATFQERLVPVCGAHGISNASCIIEVLDVEARGGLGAVIGRGTISSSLLQGVGKRRAPMEVAIETHQVPGTTMPAFDPGSTNERKSFGVLSCEVSWQRLGSCIGHEDVGGRGNATTAGKTGAMAEIVGRRSVRILGSQSMHAVIPESLRRPGRDRNKQGDAVGVRTAILFGPDTIILEGNIRQHMWHETLRSNFKIENRTGIPLCVLLSFADGGRRSLGTIPPGRSIPLPFGWQRPGSQLHATPALYEDKHGASVDRPAHNAPKLRYGWGVVDISTLTTLTKDGGSNGSSWTAHGKPLECYPVVSGASLAMMFCLCSSSEVVHDSLDWKIEIVPPIKIRNHVPVPVSMFVADGGGMFETSSGADFPLHLDIVDPGGDMPIYFTGSRGSLRFRMDAAEYKWAERDMACLTGDGQRDSIRLKSDTQRIPSDIFLSRYQTSSQCTYPVVITLVSPLWILNKTEWMIETAVVPVVGAGDKGSVALDPQHAPHEDSFAAVLVTSAEDSTGSDAPGGSLANARQVPPKSQVLSSIPMGYSHGSNPKANNGNRANPATRAYGLRVRVQRSGWTDPILLDEEHATKHGLVALSSRPILLKADSPAHSAVFGTVLRLEMNEFNDSRILHIDAQMLLQNSCRVNLEGLQTAIDHGRRQHGAHGEGGPGRMRESIVLPRGGVQLEDSSNHPFVQIADNSIQTILKAKAIFGIPGDSVPRPLTFLRGAGAPTVCFRSAQRTAYENVGMWSRPLELSVLEEGLEYIVLPCVNAGSLEGTLLLRLSVTSRGPGLRLITLESAECSPRYTLANRCHHDLMYREVGWRGATTRRLPGFSAVGVVPTFSKDPDTFELEIFGNGMEPYARSIVLSDRRGQGGGLESSEPNELVVSSTTSCVVRTLFQPPSCLSCVGLNSIPGAMSGYSVGRGGVEKWIDVVDVPRQGDPGRPTSSLERGDQREAYIVVEVPGISISIVDFEREICLLTFDDIKVELDRILMPESVGSFVHVVARHVQLDNQLPGSLLPVAICKSVDATSNLPLIDVRHASYQSKARTGLHLPYIGCRTPNKVQLAVDERLVWKLVEYMGIVDAMRGSPGDAAAMVRSVDAFVRLRLLSVAGVGLSVSFQNNAKARPPSFQETSYSLMLDLAAFKGAEVRLKGFEFENVQASQSVMVARIAERVRSELVAAAFSLVRQFGIVGGATRLFGFLGAKVARFAEGPSLASPESPAQQDASLGASFLKGFRGVVSALASGTTSQERQDASFARGRSGVMVLERKRLPRVLNEMQGLRDASGSSSQLLERLGQAFLWSTWLASPSTQNTRLEDFEEHVVLPAGLVLVFTSVSVLLVDAPGFAAVVGAVERDGSLPNEVFPGTIRWRSTWNDVEHITLGAVEDDVVVFHIVLHRHHDDDHHPTASRPPTPVEIQCFSTPQAREIVMIAKRIRAYYV